MRANPIFSNRPPSFWGYVKVISEQLGYSNKQEGVIKYTPQKILNKLQLLNIPIDPAMLKDIIDYTNYRSDVLNEIVSKMLMNKDEASKAFVAHLEIHRINNLTCKLPLNKQKGEKKDYAYFTGIINIITECVLRNYAQAHKLPYGSNGISFDDDPRNLTYIQDDEGYLLGTLSRRFDGAFPQVSNPLAFWEIKEYYCTTTFGSRISDGVYETQLDGFELNSILPLITRPIKHIYFIDDYNTWWNMGRSYLCRIIDTLHIGLVDEVIFGREVFERWPVVLNELIMLLQ